MHFVSEVDDQLAHTTYVTDFHRFVVETFLLEVQVKNAGPSELVDEIINVAYTVLYLASVEAGDIRRVFGHQGSLVR